LQEQAPFELTSRYSPMTGIPRGIRWVAGHQGRERLCTFCIFSLVPMLLFWAWYMLAVRHNIRSDYHYLSYTMPVSSLWIAFGPMLVQQWEFNLERLIATFNATGETDGWNLKDIQRSIDRADRTYYWFTLPLALAASLALLLAFPALASIITIRGFLAKLAGILVILAVGFTSASGIWGAVKALLVVRGATRRAKIAWLPFRSQQAGGIHEVYLFTWTTAVFFSAGSVFLPSLFVVQTQLPTTAKVIVWIFAALLFAGGLVLFTVPARMLYRLGQTQKGKVLDTLAPPLEAGMSAVADPGQQSTERLEQLGHAVEIALKLRREIGNQSPAPVFNFVARAAATLVLPILITLIQVAVTSTV
jgi:disulfide bond formation protein DsbB